MPNLEIISRTTTLAMVSASMFGSAQVTPHPPLKILNQRLSVHLPQLGPGPVHPRSPPFV